MPRRHGQRSNLPATKTLQPEFGARHPIVYEPDVDLFFDEIAIKLDETVPKAVTTDDHGVVIKMRRQFRVYNDPSKVGVNVLERRLSKAYAQKQRVRWTRGDVGRIKGEIRDEIDRLGIDPDDLEARFTHIVRLGDADSSPHARKLGLILDQETPLAELLTREHEIVIGGLRGSLTRFRYPYETYVPHWTVARIARQVDAHGSEHLTNAVSAVQSLLPMTVQLDPINLFAQQNV